MCIVVWMLVVVLVLVLTSRDVRVEFTGQGWLAGARCHMFTHTASCLPIAATQTSRRHIDRCYLL